MSARRLMRAIWSTQISRKTRQASCTNSFRERSAHQERCCREQSGARLEIPIKSWSIPIFKASKAVSERTVSAFEACASSIWTGRRRFIFLAFDTEMLYHLFEWDLIGQDGVRYGNAGRPELAGGGVEGRGGWCGRRCQLQFLPLAARASAAEQV